jgi:hypothetical protein
MQGEKIVREQRAAGVAAATLWFVAATVMFVLGSISKSGVDSGA